MREQVGSQGGQVTVAQLPAKACPILSCKTSHHPATTTLARSWRRAAGTESTRRVREEGALHQFDQRAHHSWVGWGQPSEHKWELLAGLGDGSDQAAKRDLGKWNYVLCAFKVLQCYQRLAYHKYSRYKDNNWLVLRNICWRTQNFLPNQYILV